MAIENLIIELMQWGRFITLIDKKFSHGYGPSAIRNTQSKILILSASFDEKNLWCRGYFCETSGINTARGSTCST